MAYINVKFLCKFMSFSNFSLKNLPLPRCDEFQKNLCHCRDATNTAIEDWGSLLLIAAMRWMMASVSDSRAALSNKRN